MRTYISLFIFLINACQAINTFAKPVKIQGGELVTEHAITFKEGTAILTEEAKQGLAEVRAYLDEKTYITTLRIEAHVFNTSTNQKLSDARAMAVSVWLVNAGIDCKRLIAVGFANTKPVTEKGNDTRIVFVNAALRGHAIGGMPLDGNGRVAGDSCAQ